MSPVLSDRVDLGVPVGYRVLCYYYYYPHLSLSLSLARGRENRELKEQGREERTGAVVAPLFRVEWSGTQVEYPAHLGTLS